MLKIVLDTNVVVSAILSPGGNPSLILREVLSGKHFFYYTFSILTEYEEVLFRPEFHFDAKRVRFTLDSLAERGILTAPPKRNFSLPDESDRIFFDLACSTGALLVTGNGKHYPAESFVVTPAQAALLLNLNNNTD